MSHSSAFVQVTIRWDDMLIELRETFTTTEENGAVVYSDVAEVLEALYRRAKAALDVGYAG